MMPPHPAYSDPSTVAFITRKSLSDGPKEKDMLLQFGYSDVNKGVEKIWELSRLESPPHHLPLGMDAVKFLKDKGVELIKAAEEYESWSHDLLLKHT